MLHHTAPCSCCSTNTISCPALKLILKNANRKRRKWEMFSEQSTWRTHHFVDLLDPTHFPRRNHPVLWNPDQTTWFLFYTQLGIMIDWLSLANSTLFIRMPRESVYFSCFRRAGLLSSESAVMFRHFTWHRLNKSHDSHVTFMQDPDFFSDAYRGLRSSIIIITTLY